MGNDTKNRQAAPPEAAGLPDVLTVTEFAGALRVSAATIRNWIAQGTIVTTPHPGRHHRIPRAELDRLMTPRRTR